MNAIKNLRPEDFGRPFEPRAFSRLVKAAARYRGGLGTLSLLVLVSAAASVVFAVLKPAGEYAGMPWGVWVDLVMLGMVFLLLVICLPALGVLAQRRGALDISKKEMKAALRSSKARLRGQTPTPAAAQAPSAAPVQNAQAPPLREIPHPAPQPRPVQPTPAPASAQQARPAGGFCGECGMPLDADQKFCTECGTTVS